MTCIQLIPSLLQLCMNSFFCMTISFGFDMWAIFLSSFGLAYVQTILLSMFLFIFFLLFFHSHISSKKIGESHLNWSFIWLIDGWMDGWMACFCLTSSVEVGMYVWSFHDFDHEIMSILEHRSYNLTKLKAKARCIIVRFCMTLKLWPW